MATPPETPPQQLCTLPSSDDCGTTAVSFVAGESTEVYVGRTDGMLLLVAVESMLATGSEQESPCILASGDVHSAAVTAISPVGEQVCSCSLDFRVVLSSRSSAEPDKLVALRYVECSEPAWCLSATVHRVAFADIGGAVTIVDLHPTPTAADFGISPGSAVQLHGLSKGCLNGYW